MAKGENLILFGFAEIIQMFPFLRREHVVFPVPNRYSREFKFFERALKKLARRGALGRISYNESSTVLLRSKGHIPLAIFDAENAQSFVALDQETMIHFFEQVGSNLDNGPLKFKAGGGQGHTCFVHIRKGDYLYFPSEESSIALPESWFYSNMLEISREYPGVMFKIYTDQPESLGDRIRKFPNAVTRKTGTVETFVEMANSDMGILSASSFSWWAALIALHRGAGGPFCAPEYWLGWRERTWDPPGLISDKIRYVKAEL